MPGIVVAAATRVNAAARLYCEDRRNTMPFEKTAARLWKRLGREERLAAASEFWRETPQEIAGAALAAIVKARHLRPQSARLLGEEEKARSLAAVLEPGETVASALLVALHLGPRRPMLAAFLDAAGLPHENGLLKEDDTTRPSEAATRAGVRALAASFTPAEIETYLNTLWLQDPERWEALLGSHEWI